ncbi:hypothetical protein EOPP23_12155 [Endozoicomonas sp. OPT23]|uniref:type VI secretion system protein TssA n=1 Tax=Endozoicomonas sp. OPT23 TaxID=2072845 RepID=UPI00129B9673|nr:type VI secretion system ImpA family N-terminal domain-containing protein [Endozoicomonas sp. OPT23]MRI33740.1 hypothetical protein [Endozoicomonas sp. OPT23]
MQAPLTEEELDSFLVPLSEEHPAGEFIKGNRALFRPLRNAYNIAQTSFHKLAMNPEDNELDELRQANQENWQSLEELLLDCLKQHSRDLECMAWLAMASLFSSQPYAQLASIIQLTDQSLNSFWPKVQPYLPDEKCKTDDTAYERANHQYKAIQRLLGESEDSCPLVPPLCMLPLVADIDFANYQRSKSSLHDLKQQVTSSLPSEKSDIVARINDILAVQDALDSLDATLKRLFTDAGVHVPTSQFLRKQLDANLQALKDLSDGMITPWPPDLHKQTSLMNEQSKPQAEPKPEQEEISQKEPAQFDQHNIVMDRAGFTRDQAFQQIRMLSDFFQRTEPQSPVPYILEKAIRWGYTPLPQLMNELLLGNDNLMGRIKELTGMDESDKTPLPAHVVSTAPLSNQSLQKQLATPDANLNQKESESSIQIETASQEPLSVDPAPEKSAPEQNISQKKRVNEQSVSSTMPSSQGGMGIHNLNDLS